MNNPLITIVCPVFNEEQAVPLFYERLSKSLSVLADTCQFKILFTNNASTDNTLKEIHALRAKDERVEVLSYSRNFGYQASLLGGLKHAQGDAIVVIDVDCEDPPEMIPQFVQKWQEGFDIVYGLRGNRPEPRWLVRCRKLFYRLMKALADAEIILDMAEFSLFSSVVRDEMVRNSNTFPFLRAEIAYAGFRKFGIPYDRQARIIGQSHYNLFGMSVFAVAGILSVSTFPFRMAVYLWPLVAVCNVVILFADMLWELPGLFKLICVFDFLYLSGVVSLFGLYIARIYKNGINRPVYVVDWLNTTVTPGMAESVRSSFPTEQLQYN
jgi:polyisoprenyl-phosphate glycosyltransferase